MRPEATPGAGRVFDNNPACGQAVPADNVPALVNQQRGMACVDAVPGRCQPDLEPNARRVGSLYVSNLPVRCLAIWKAASTVAGLEAVSCAGGPVCGGDQTDLNIYSDRPVTSPEDCQDATTTPAQSYGR